MRGERRRGSPHASKVPYTRGTFAEKYGEQASATNLQMGQAVDGYWANFARPLDPNGPGLLRLMRYDADTDGIVNFRADGTAATAADPRRAELDLVETTRGNASEVSEHP